METAKSPVSTAIPTGQQIEPNKQANMFRSNFDDNTAQRVLQVLIDIYNKEKGTNYKVDVKRIEKIA